MIKECQILSLLFGATEADKHVFYASTKNLCAWYNKHKKEQLYIKLDNLDYWFVMGYLIGDGWIEETTKEDGRCVYKIRFAIIPSTKIFCTWYNIKIIK